MIRLADLRGLRKGRVLLVAIMAAATLRQDGYLLAFCAVVYLADVLHGAITERG